MSIIGKGFGGGGSGGGGSGGGGSNGPYEMSAASYSPANRCWCGGDVFVDGPERTLICADPDCRRIYIYRALTGLQFAGRQNLKEKQSEQPPEQQPATQPEKPRNPFTRELDLD